MSDIRFQLLRPHAWPEVASFSRSACRSSKLEYHLEYSHYYLATTIPPAGSGGNSRRNIQTPPSVYESQLDAPTNQFLPRLASCSYLTATSQTELFTTKPGYTSVATLTPKLRFQWPRLILQTRVAYGTQCHPGHVPAPIKWPDLIQLASRIQSPKKIVARKASNCVFKNSTDLIKLQQHMLLISGFEL